MYGLAFLITLIPELFFSAHRANAQSLSAELEILRAKQACFESLNSSACDKSALTEDELKLLSSLADYAGAKMARIASMGLSAGAVSFFESGVQEIEDDLLKLRNGSAWQVSGYLSSISRFKDAIVVLRARGKAAIFLDGSSRNASLLFGSYVPQSGTLDTVIKEVGDGAVLILESGGMLEVDSYDTYDTRFWLPPYQVIISDNGMYMWNLDEGEKVGINVVR